VEAACVQIRVGVYRSVGGHRLVSSDKNVVRLDCKGKNGIVIEDSPNIPKQQWYPKLVNIPGDLINMLGEST
jgi:hypothetical protein